jgi:hypothetical protein
MEAAGLRNSLHLATNGTDKGTSRRSLLNWGSPELMRALPAWSLIGGSRLTTLVCCQAPCKKFHPVVHGSFALNPLSFETYDLLENI